MIDNGIAAMARQIEYLARECEERKAEVRNLENELKRSENMREQKEKDRCEAECKVAELPSLASARLKEGTWAWACVKAFENPGTPCERGESHKRVIMVVSAHGRLTLGNRPDCLYPVDWLDVSATDWRQVKP